MIVTFRDPLVPKTGERDCDSTQKSTRKVIQKKTTQKILDLIAQNPKITREMLAEEIGISANGIKYHLRQMQKKALIRRIGPDKGGR